MNGIVNVLKPPGMTSNDVVSYIRKVSGIKKVGHTGTLDPGAAGVLPVCLGKSTKIVDYIMNDKKTYICEVTLGNTTDTYDKYGTFLYETDNECPTLTEKDLLELIKRFTGVITQKPPAYSAIKLNGKRAYDLAREGISVDIPERKVTVYSIELLNYKKNKMMLRIVCSKGTYIRSICKDIGDIIGCGAYMSFLIRSGTGIFDLKNCSALEEINKDNLENLLVSPDKCLKMKSVVVPLNYKNKLMNGNSISTVNLSSINPSINDEAYACSADDNFVKIYLENNEFIGIGIMRKNILYVEKLLF